MDTDLFLLRFLLCLLCSFCLRKLSGRRLNFNLCNFLNVLAFLNLVIHFFEFFFVFLFFIIFITLLVIFNFGFQIILLSWVFFILAKIQIFQLSHYADVLQLTLVSNNFRMSKFWCVVSLKIGELFQKSWDLSNNPEKVVGVWMIMHLKSFDSFIIFDNRIEWFLL